MEHRTDYFVKGRQLEKLAEELEKIDEFRKHVTDMEDLLDANEMKEWREAKTAIGYSAFLEALRELKYLVEDIGGQEIGEEGGL